MADEIEILHHLNHFIFHLAEAQMESDTLCKLLQAPLLFWIAPVTISNVTLLSSL